MLDQYEETRTVLELTLEVWTKRWTGRLLGPAKNQRRQVVRFVDGGVVDPANLTWLNGMAHSPGASFVSSPVTGRTGDRKAVASLLLKKAPRLLADFDPARRVALDRSFRGNLEELELDIELLLILDEQLSLGEAEQQLFPEAFEQLRGLIVMGAVTMEQVEEVSISFDLDEDEDEDVSDDDSWIRQERGRQIGMARLAMEVGRWTEAEEALEKAEMLGADSPELHLERAWIILNTPRRDRKAGQREAQRRLARALELDFEAQHLSRCMDVMRLLVSRSSSQVNKVATG